MALGVPRSARLVPAVGAKSLDGDDVLSLALASQRLDDEDRECFALP
jgi:hypothetical protein